MIDFYKIANKNKNLDFFKISLQIFVEISTDDTKHNKRKSLISRCAFHPQFFRMTNNIDHKMNIFPEIKRLVYHF